MANYEKVNMDDKFCGIVKSITEEIMKTLKRRFYDGSDIGKKEENEIKFLEHCVLMVVAAKVNKTEIPEFDSMTVMRSLYSPLIHMLMEINGVEKHMPEIWTEGDSTPLDFLASIFCLSLEKEIQVVNHGELTDEIVKGVIARMRGDNNIH